jgi:hypothetical protein
MGLDRPLGYADDMFLQGAPAPTMLAFAALTAAAAPLGLQCHPPSALSTPRTMLPPPLLRANSV